MSRIRIRINQNHIAYINKALLQKYQYEEKVLNINAHIQEILYKELNLRINSSEEIANTTKVLNEMYYSDIGEYLAEYFRNKLK